MDCCKVGSLNIVGPRVLHRSKICNLQFKAGLQPGKAADDLSADGLQTADLLKMECLVLHTTRFRIMRPNAYTILCLLQKAMQLLPHESALAMYLTVRFQLTGKSLHIS